VAQPYRAGLQIRSLSPVALVAWSIAFGLAYAQAPLFTSNQNQYLLHGLARAGYGHLRLDWLANTVDPTPVFSFLVEITYRLLPAGVFYLWTFLLFGVYLYSLEGLASDLFHLRDDPVKRRVFLALFVAAHAALARFILQRVLGDAWGFTLEGGLAGQRILGSVLEPSMFGVLLLLSIYLFHRRETVLSVVCAVAAATIHPTYLLSAGLLTTAYALAAFLDRDRRRALGIPALALILVAPILLYASLNFTTSSPANLAQAQAILVRERIPHHTLIQVWWNASSVVQILIVVAGIALVRKTRLFVVMVVCAASVLVLSVFQILTGNQALALIFPWRPSVFLVPMGTTFVIGYAVGEVWRRCNLGSEIRHGRRDLLGRASISLVVILALAGVVKFRIDQGQASADPARDVMAFVRRSSVAGDVYMIPPYLQDFRLETGAPILVDFKSIPYRANEVIEWYDRLLLARAFYRDRAADVSCRALRDAATRYGVTHVVLAQAQFGAGCGPWVERYRDADFAVYALVPH
jgi:hypothetical protein